MKSPSILRGLVFHAHENLVVLRFDRPVAIGIQLFAKVVRSLRAAARCRDGDLRDLVLSLQFSFCSHPIVVDLKPATPSACDGCDLSITAPAYAVTGFAH